MTEELTDKRRRRLEDFVSPFQVRPQQKVTLPGDFDPAFKGGLRKKKEGQKLLREGVELLSTYQARLAAQDTWGVLVVLQAIDAAGKDGTIRHVMSGVNPQGVSVHSFKVPSAEELSHDYLWRYSRRLPARGEIGIFNRSHYEEVLAVRIHPEYLDRQGLPDAARDGETWQRRYREINDWERYLSENGIRIVKIFLNLSKEEQRARLLRRIDLPDHNWKFSTADITERGPLDQLPGGDVGHPHPYQHRLGALARDPGRPQVVRPDRDGGGPGRCADRARSPPPPGGRRPAGRSAGGETTT